MMSQPKPEYIGPALRGDALRHALGRTREAWLCLERQDDDGAMTALAAQRRDASGKPVAELVAQIGSALIGAMTGRLRRARRELAESEQHLTALGIAGLRPHWEQAALVCDWMAGEWSEAERRSAQLVALPPAPPGLTLSVRVELLAELDRAAEASELIERLRAQPRSAMGCCAVASTMSDPTEAVAELRDAGSCERLGMLPVALYRTARCARRLGDESGVSWAHEVFDQLERSDPLAEILAALTEAVATGKPAPARRAQELAEAEGLHPLVAEALAIQGGLGYYAAGTLRAARDRWLAIGAVARADELTELLGDRHGVRLSPRERELVKHVQSGLSNQEIATTIHLSVKSVEAYLTRVYVKTGCRSRVELALAAADGRISDTGQVGELSPASRRPA